MHLPVFLTRKLSCNRWDGQAIGCSCCSLLQGAGVRLQPVARCRRLKLLLPRTTQELGLEVRLKNANFIEDASCIKSDDYKKINPMEKCVATRRPIRMPASNDPQCHLARQCSTCKTRINNCKVQCSMRW